MTPPRDQRPDHRSAPMPPVDTQARQHASVREAHETELIEDYVELLADLIDTDGAARAVEIARRMGVRQATVAKMIRRLTEQGLVVTEPYRPVYLTRAGRAMAERSRERHAVVLSFLRRLGVSDTTARVDAEGIEHHVSAETLDLMRRFAAAGGED